MAKKKHLSPHISQEDTIQAQRVFKQYHQIAEKLRTSTSRTQVEAALAVISALPASVQMALLKMLSREPHTDAADILHAINEVSSVKEVRKEAKRALIQLQEAKISPQWSLPAEQPTAIEVSVVGNAPRFWKGSVTDTRESGEVQLILAWEQGNDYKEVRVLGFLLEFWRDGVKDCFTRVQSKRSFENFLERMIAEMPGVKSKNCSLAGGRRLLLEALAVNQKMGTLPHRDYRLNQSLINQLVLEHEALDEDEDEDEDEDDEEELESEESDFDEDTDDDDGGDGEEPISLQDLDPGQVVTTFVNSYIDGEFDTAYELLASDSSLREGLSQEEWIDRRDTWLDEANPGDLEPNLLFERKPQKSKLWLPNVFSADKSPASKVIEAGWSIEMEETPLSETLPELPQATAVFEETGRHWFWASFNLIQDQGQWRIQSITNEGSNAQERSIEELRTTIREHFNGIEDIASKHKPTDKNALQYAEDMVQHLMLAVFHSDALIKKAPDDPSVYEEAAAYLLSFGLNERGLVYLEPLTRRFTENRAFNLEQMANAQRDLSEKYFEMEDDERGERFLELAEQTLTELLALEDTFAVRIALAEVLIERDERLDEAEEHLHRASTFTTDPLDVAHIELHLGEIATEREQYEEALQHYQRVVELKPDDADALTNLAIAYEKLGDLEEAEANYRHAIKLRPDDPDLYYVLSTIFAKHEQPDRAIEIIEEGLSEIPDSAVLNIYLATLYLDHGDARQAEIFLKQAERIDPDASYVQMFRGIFNLTRQTLVPTPRKFSGKKKKRK